MSDAVPPQSNPFQDNSSDTTTTAGLPVAPALGPALGQVSSPRETAIVDARTAAVSGMAILLAIVTALAAKALTTLIAFITNVSFYGQTTAHGISPAGNHLGAWVIAIPIAGAIVVGLMARFGSTAIRGHGIPEAMEQVLFNKSRMPPRLVFLKPLSAAVSIGTGGPFGSEGPIIATGGALGSVLGQLVRTTAHERKTLLAAGAAAGMAAIFGTPVAAVLLAVELLLFEYRARSVVPVALASAAAAAVRFALGDSGAVFPMVILQQPGGLALTGYIVLGAVMGVIATVVTRAVYGIEDAFEHLPVHWMWWPALGAIAVGVVGYADPRTLGVGYENIENMLNGHIIGTALLMLGVLKFVSWSVSLGSGTSGGTLAPLLTIGGALGGTFGTWAGRLAPHAGFDPRIAALVGMGALFAGASRALLASVVFAFEATRQPLGLLPLLGGCTASFFISSLMMRHSIMTEKIARRGGRALGEDSVDHLDTVLVKDAASYDVVVLAAEETLAGVRAWIASRIEGSGHQGFPVVDANGALLGVVTRRDLLDELLPGERRLQDVFRRPPAVVFEDNSLREAADHMVRENVGRLAVVSPEFAPRTVIGIITRSDLLSAHHSRLDEMGTTERSISLRPSLRRAGS